MLFFKKKRKLDSKVRFQHKQFTTKLDTARNFKRSAKAVPETKLEQFLVKVGLGSRWSQILLGLLVLALLYLIYIPNFLTVREIYISGLSQQQTDQLEAAIRKHISDSPFYNPQYNLVFLSDELIYRAAADVPSVDVIASVKKDFRSQSLAVEAASKYERFLLTTPEQVYDLYNDGTVKGVAGVALADWESHQNPNMVKLRLFQSFDANTNQAVFEPTLFAYLGNLVDGLPIVAGQHLAYLTFREPEQLQLEPVLEPQPESVPPAESDAPAEELNIEQSETPPAPPEPVFPKMTLPFNSSEVHAVFYKNNDLRRTFVVIFDATADARKSLEALQLLLLQTSPERYDQLVYIDLRLPEKAFVCLQGAKCVQ